MTRYIDAEQGGYALVKAWDGGVPRGPREWPLSSFTTRTARGRVYSRVILDRPWTTRNTVIIPMLNWREGARHVPEVPARTLSTCRISVSEATCDASHSFRCKFGQRSVIRGTGTCISRLTDRRNSHLLEEITASLDVRKIHYTIDTAREGAKIKICERKRYKITFSPCSLRSKWN